MGNGIQTRILTTEVWPSVQSTDLAIPQPKGEEEEEQRKRGRCRSSGLRTQIICGLQVRGEGGGGWKVQDAPGRV